MKPSRIVDTDPVRAAQELFEEAVTAAVADRGRAVVALSGGSTPVPLYERLVTADLPWGDVWVVFGDERFVPPTDPRSNSRAARRALLDHVAVPREQVLAWPILGTPEESATQYEADLTEAFGDFPTLDLNLMGLGGDGHTASLFPRTGTALMGGNTVATHTPAGVEPAGWRLSLTAPALSNSRTVLFLVTGEAKRGPLVASFGPEATEGPDALASGALDAYPARAIGALGRLYVVTDVDY